MVQLTGSHIHLDTGNSTEHQPLNEQLAAQSLVEQSSPSQFERSQTILQKKYHDARKLYGGYQRMRREDCARMNGRFGNQEESANR